MRESIAPEYQAEVQAQSNQGFDGFTIIPAKHLQQRKHFKNEISGDPNTG
ncbi:hypothetical protein H3S83_07870 [Bartonella sp. W8122]|nr:MULTISPECIES: hypothetical protein [Bartonella]MBI0001744.1 hypothetical protein [Bartonella sp. W8122]MBI0021417.1 hypothetical protein [Bartonella apihabitans]